MAASSNVLADAQFSVVRILRPWDGAVALDGPYNGQPTTTPIMLTEVLDPPGGEPRDQFAVTKTLGYDPNLVRGIDVPLGSRVLLWLPAIQAGGSPEEPWRYRWSIMWRLRNTFDYRNARIPYHYPKQGEGVPDTTPGAAGPRVVIPAALQTLPYSQSPEPTGAGDRVTTNLRTEFNSTGNPGYGGALPFMPGGVRGVIQQGIANPAVNAAAPFPLYQLCEVQAVGDELLIGLSRELSLEAPVWDFATNDFFVAQYLGSNFPDIGVYVLTGSAP